MKVVLFGVGGHIDKVEGLLQEEVDILFYLDNDRKKQMELRNGKKVYSLKESPNIFFDYVIISVLNYQSIEQQLIESGCSEKKILPFFRENFPFETYSSIFKPIQSIQYSLKYSLIHYCTEQIERKQKLFTENLMYEVADKFMKGSIELPRICSVEDTCKKIIQDKVSVSRYGDGEFQIILGSAKDIYQDNDKELGERLIEILVSNLAGHIVALADDYGCMEGLREENKNTIRRYMTVEKRRQHYQYIDMKKQYYNAYISRPYVIYPHDEREKAYKRFVELRKIWNRQKLLLVEGDCTRMGVGNDLFSNAESIERIIAPNKNAFSVYYDILNAVLQVKKNRLVLIALGPTATVLAYDLSKEGYWAIDIGHLDLEYEWYLKGEGYSDIPNKYNNEVAGGTIVEDIFDETYNKSIINKIESVID